MKQFIAIIASFVALSVFAAEPATAPNTSPAKHEMKLAKKAEHKKSPSAGSPKTDSKAKTAKK